MLLHAQRLTGQPNSCLHRSPPPGFYLFSFVFGAERIVALGTHLFHFFAIQLRREP
jgi:hypothetical protein